MQLPSSALLGWFEVCCRGERHFCNNGIVGSASDDHLELGVLLAILLVHIPHGNVLLQAWTESPAGDLSNLQSTGQRVGDATSREGGWGVVTSHCFDMPVTPTWLISAVALLAGLRTAQLIKNQVATVVLLHKQALHQTGHPDIHPLVASQ